MIYMMSIWEITGDKRLKRGIVMKILLILLVVLVVWTAYHQTMKKTQLNNIKPMGTMVDVDGKKMHVYMEGTGDKTVVILPGFGTVHPEIIMRPLIEELKNEYKVVVVDYFGYGYSDLTHKERTNKNIVEEVREALTKAEIKGPYILMPHSMGNLYATYYAQNYPGEVEGIVSIDGSTPEQMISQPKASTFQLNTIGAVETIGAFRMLAFFTKLPDDYSKEEKELYKKFTANKSFNKTMRNEMAHSYENGKELLENKIPKNIPMLRIVAQGTVDQSPKMKMDWLALQEKTIEGLDNGKCVVIDGSHLLMLDNSKGIGEATREFIG